MSEASSIQAVAINEFRRSYTRYAQLVRFENKTLVIKRYGEVVGCFVAPSKLEKLNLTKTEDRTAQTFRNEIGYTWERLYSGELEAMYVTHHRRRWGAFIGPKVAASIGIKE